HDVVDVVHAVQVDRGPVGEGLRDRLHGEAMVGAGEGDLPVQRAEGDAEVVGAGPGQLRHLRDVVLGAGGRQRRVHVVEVPGQCSGHAPTVQVRRTGIPWSMTVAPLLDTDVVARHTLAHDASHYLLLPEAVTAPADEAEVVA